jgi:hypothetical protein
VHLRVEIIENPHPVSGAQKLLCEVRSNEAGAPDDECCLYHFGPPNDPSKTPQFRVWFHCRQTKIQNRATPIA